MPSPNSKAMTVEKRTGWILAAASTLGLFASFMLSVEEYHHLQHPTQALSCDINPLIGCGNILSTWQGHVIFGIPNQFFGLIAFAVLLTIGVLLISGLKLPRWIWKGLQLGAIAGLLSVFWFMYQSLFVLNHLCPYCMVTWVATLVASWYITVHNLRADTWHLPKWLQKASVFVQAHHLDIIITVFVILVASVLLRFRSFFFG